MDYIKVAEKLGFNRNLAISVYKKISGGYFISLYYAKNPILYTLDNWPKKFLNRRFLSWYDTSFNSEIDQIISLFITLDVKIIYRVSSILLSYSEVDYEKDIEDVFEEIKITSQKLGIFNYPQKTKISLKESLVEDLVSDILRKREKEINTDIYSILAEIASESDYLTKIKEEKNWIRAISKDNILKALYLENKLSNFLEEERVKINYLIASRFKIFDKLVLNKGIKETILEIRESKDEELKEKINEFYSQLNKEMNYF